MSKKIKAICVIGIALTALLFTSGADAASKKTPFKKYIHKSFYETKLKNTASALAFSSDSVDASSCPMRNTTFARLRYEVLEQPIFKTKRRHPFKGIWVEKVNIFICGKATEIDVTVVANKDGKLPKFDASLSRTKAATAKKKQPHFYGDYNLNN